MQRTSVGLNPFEEDNGKIEIDEREVFDDTNPFKESDTYDDKLNPFSD